jgi:hypothetical protein
MSPKTKTRQLSSSSFAQLLPQLGDSDCLAILISHLSSLVSQDKSIVQIEYFMHLLVWWVREMIPTWSFEIYEIN